MDFGYIIALQKCYMHLLDYPPSFIYFTWNLVVRFFFFFDIIVINCWLHWCKLISCPLFVAGSMISPVEVEGAGVQSLYVDLCNLIVESRTPTRDARGYGDGTHCRPMLGHNSHTCDPTNTQVRRPPFYFSFYKSEYLKNIYH